MPPRVERLPRQLRRYLKEGPVHLLEATPLPWRALIGGVKPPPVVELHYDGVPTHWDTPEYRQDVPKR